LPEAVPATERDDPAAEVAALLAEPGPRSTAAELVYDRAITVANRAEYYRLLLAEYIDHPG
jgi:hypothetical protein